MPVPVPRLHKPVAHPVVKRLNCADTQTNQFQNLTRSLPLSPTGPPPSYGTREQWINSLPSWRRTKPRRIWEDDAQIADRPPQGFCQGLTAAANASVIKGAHAEACIPPLHILLEARQPSVQLPSAGSDNDADDEMNSDYSSSMDRNHFDDQSQWSASSPIAPHRKMLDDPSDLRDATSYTGLLPDLQVERCTFPPIFEDKSTGEASGQERDSSPLQPITPFGDFVDRAVASVQSYHDGEMLPPDDVVGEDQACGPQCYPPQPPYPIIAEHRLDPAPDVVTPAATTGYKKLAEPLADWVANYIWKICTTGLSLPSTFVREPSDSVSSYPSIPPSYLASSVHSLLLSTLLQPSAVFLAIWYIIRLPVYFAASPLEPEFVKEARFRAALLGDSSLGPDQETTEASAPFRLIVLGCMLANKWLDDHTFSNKTWHSISNVPVQALNKLESLALDIFAYDLNVSSHNWSQWLAHLMSYHMSMASPNHPQPISRPSSNPHSIVKRVLEEITQAPVACNTSPSQPVFLGLEERKREKIEKEQAMAVEIDLDEDGPLRAEYLPKRRESYRAANSMPQPDTNDSHLWDSRNIQDMERLLPPPARWSPAGDEPIHRERNRVSGQYVAVQPPMLHSIPAYPHYYQHVDPNFSHWNMGPAYAPVEPQAAYHFNLPLVDVGTYNPYPYGSNATMSHSRSQSLSYDQENMRRRNHARTYSQARFAYRCSDVRMSANEVVCHQSDAPWIGPNQYSYNGPVFAPVHNVHYPPAWVRI